MTNPPRSPRLRPVFLLSGLLATVPFGCGSGGSKVPLYPAGGTVTIGDAPAAGVMVRLYGPGGVGDLDSPQPYATTGPDGSFRLGTFAPGDGAPAGRYSVMLLWPEGPPGPGVPVDRLQGTFSDPARSPFKVEVGPQPTTFAPIRIDPRSVKTPPRRKPVSDPQNPTG